MYDVRRELGVSTVRWKVKKRVLERIGHVMRMGDDRLTKQCIVGWMEELEKFDKPQGRSRKTFPYWKKIMREAGLDPTDAASLTKDRKLWKSKVVGRTKHLAEWERSKGNKWQGAAMARNEIVVNVQVFDCRVCGKVCKSKGGLVNHRRRMHEELTAKKTFECVKCEKVFKKESEIVNHEKVCGGAVASKKERVKCVCGKEYSKGYFRSHRLGCDQWQRHQQHQPQPQAEAMRAPVAPCPTCGKVMRRDNLARHANLHCPGSVAGP